MPVFRRPLVAVVLGLFAALAPRATACSICRCGDPTFNALGAASSQDIWLVGSFFDIGAARSGGFETVRIAEGADREARREPSKQAVELAVR